MQYWCLIFIFLGLSSAQAYDDIQPKQLNCIEGQYRLQVDFIKQDVFLFERDPFTQIERNLFGIRHLISNFQMCPLPQRAPKYYSFDLKIKNDGVLKGKFNLELDSTTNSRKGLVKYEGWFSWEPIVFNDCELIY